MIQMKNRIRDYITCVIASSDHRGKKKSKFYRTDERSGRLIDCAKLGHIPVGGKKSTARNVQERLADTMFIKRN